MNCWYEWLITDGSLLKYLPLPLGAMIDEFHFDDFAWNYAKQYPIEPFKVDLLSDVESVILLCTLDSYFRYICNSFLCERCDSLLWRDLRKILGLMYEPYEDITAPIFMRELYRSYLNKYKITKYEDIQYTNRLRPFKNLKIGVVYK
jgi:hypothetical protein